MSLVGSVEVDQVRELMGGLEKVGAAVMQFQVKDAFEEKCFGVLREEGSR